MLYLTSAAAGLACQFARPLTPLIAFKLLQTKNSNQTVTNLPLYNTKVISTLEWHDM